MKAYQELLEEMQRTYEALTGFSPDDASDIGIRLKVLAGQLAELYEEARELREQVFPQTSSGECLELHAQTRAIVRKPALAAQGMLRFSREAPAANDIAIEAGVLCATRFEEPVYFETAEGGVLPAGELCVEIPARAAQAGAGGNAAPGAVCVMVAAPPGITAVSNPAAFGGGVDAESDGELKKRLLLSYENISNSTNRAYYYDLAMRNEGVASANILPRHRGRGTVDVVIAGFSQEREAGIVAGLQTLLDGEKEINVDVQVRAAVRDITGLTAEIAVEGDYDYGVVAEQCHQMLANLLNGMEVGEPLILAGLSSALYGVDGVYNCRVTSPGSDILTARDHVVRAGTVAVKRMVTG